LTGTNRWCIQPMVIGLAASELQEVLRGIHG
jgi:hypothetical protein